MAEPAPALSSAEFLPAPPQPAAHTFAQTHQKNSEGFSVKPFTFFNLGSASLSQPLPNKLIAAPQQKDAPPKILSFSQPKQSQETPPQQQPQPLQSQPQPLQFTEIPQQQFSVPLFSQQQPALRPTAQEFIIPQQQQQPAQPVSLAQVPDVMMEMSRSRDNVGNDMFSFPRARDPAPRPVTPGSVLFQNSSWQNLTSHYQNNFTMTHLMSGRGRKWNTGLF